MLALANAVKLYASGSAAGAGSFCPRAAPVRRPKGHRADFRNLLHLQPVLEVESDSGAGKGGEEAAEERLKKPMAMFRICLLATLPQLWYSDREPMKY